MPDVVFGYLVVEAGGGEGDGDDEAEVEEELEGRGGAMSLVRAAGQHAPVPEGADVMLIFVSVIVTRGRHSETIARDERKDRGCPASGALRGGCWRG